MIPKRAIKTGHKTCDGIEIRTGDIIIGGPLRQVWWVIGKNRLRIISEDSGIGYEDDAGLLALPGKRENDVHIIGSTIRTKMYDS